MSPMLIFNKLSRWMYQLIYLFGCSSHGYYFSRQRATTIISLCDKL